MIRVSDLWFSYDANQAVLKGINLSLARGMLISLLGPNGSGKTTLLKCLNGLLSPKRGSIYLEEKELRGLTRTEIAKLVSYVPQEHKTAFPYLVQDVVLLGLSPHLGFFATPKPKDLKRTNQLLADLGIGHLALRPYTELSGGERKLVLIARALMTASEIVIMDEPTAHLDMKHQGEVLNLIRALSRKKGLTVVMTLHDPNLAVMISDQVILLKEGQLVAQGEAASVMTKENMQALYDCQIDFFAVEGFSLMYAKIGGKPDAKR